MKEIYTHQDQKDSCDKMVSETPNSYKVYRRNDLIYNSSQRDNIRHEQNLKEADFQILVRDIKE